MKIYLSSTYMDLKRHRAVLGRAMRKAGYEVAMMEEYVARDQRVEFACQGDVVECDVYVGVFAWRYGYIPEHDNPERLSVTEMEYRAAGAKPMTRLTFLLRDKARWPQAGRDADPARITALRARLQAQCSAYFNGADELAYEVLAALRVHESTRLAQQLDAVTAVLKAQELGPSYMMNIKDQLGLLGEAEFIELQTGPIPWWNTRLYLVAALAEAFGRTRGLVFVDAQGEYLLVARPAEVRYRLAQRWPALVQAYARFRQEADTIELIEREIWRYPQFVGEAFEIDEQTAKVELTVRDLAYELGIAREAEVVDLDAKGQRFLQQEIIGRQTPLVALVRDHRLHGLVDRAQLAERVAKAALLHLV